MSIVLADPPQRTPPTTTTTVAATTSHGKNTIVPLTSPSSSSSISSSFVRGVIPPSLVSLPPSSLPAHATYIASLASIPAQELEIRKQTDHYRPIIEKEGNIVYRDKQKKSSHGFIIRPNFRELHQSDDPSNHRSLNYVTSVPPSLAASLQAASASSSQHKRILSSSSPGGAPSDRILFVRPPKRGLEDRKAKLAQEQKERHDDYEAGGLKPRAIKSVAALLQQAQAAAPGKKPTHLRLSSMKSTAADEIDKNYLSTPLMGAAAVRLSSLARGGIRLPRQGSIASSMTLPPSLLVPPAEIDSDDEQQHRQELMQQLEDERNNSSIFPSGSIHPPSVAHDDEKHAVVVSNEGAACCICTSSDFVEPLISHCKHICCSECWITWLNENPDKQCPECDAPISLESLRPIALCPICSTIPTKPWTAPCRHSCCHDCWTTWLEENPVCPECSQPIERSQMPK